MLVEVCSGLTAELLLVWLFTILACKDAANPSNGTISSFDWDWGVLGSDVVVRDWMIDGWGLSEKYDSW